MAELARDLLDRCRVPNRRISELEQCIRPLVAALAPNPLAVPGCGVLSASVVIERSILRVAFDGMR